jgi:hypothetical protein
LSERGIIMSVYPRGKRKVYYMNFTLYGIRVFKSTGKYTQHAALLAEAAEKEKIEREVRTGKKEEKVKLSVALEKCFNERWKNKADGERQKGRVQRLIDNVIGDKYLQDLEDEDIQKVITYLEKENSSVATINRYLANLKTVLNRARK